LEETNSAGRTYGPDSPELAAAVRLLDTRAGEIRDRLTAVGITPDFVIVSDHGMTPTSTRRVLILDNYVDLATVQIDFGGSAVGLRPKDGDAAALVAKFSALPHARAALVSDLPAHFHLKDHPRVPSVWIVPEPGWIVTQRAKFESARERGKFNIGDHGYDHDQPDMRGLFIASGPLIQSRRGGPARGKHPHLQSPLRRAPPEARLQ